MQRIPISRADFEDRFGFKPDDSVLSVVFYGPGNPVPHYEYVFLDDNDPGTAALEIAELQRMYALHESR